MSINEAAKSEGDPWWKTAFGAHYESLYAHRDDASAVAEVAGLLPRLRQVPGPILDACCGNGRHLAALRAAGLPAFGFDLSADLLRSANHRSQCRERMVRCDMRTPAVSGGWGAVLVLFTAFGYFDDKTNATCLATFAQLLVPGGLLVLDLPNPQAIKQKLIPRSERMTPDGHVVEERTIGQGRVEKTVTLSRDDASFNRIVKASACMNAVKSRYQLIEQSCRWSRCGRVFAAQTAMSNAAFIG